MKARLRTFPGQITAFQKWAVDEIFNDRENRPSTPASEYSEYLGERADEIPRRLNRVGHIARRACAHLPAAGGVAMVVMVLGFALPEGSAAAATPQAISTHQHLTPAASAGTHPLAAAAFPSHGGEGHGGGAGHGEHADHPEQGSWVDPHSPTSSSSAGSTEIPREGPAPTPSTPPAGKTLAAGETRGLTGSAPGASPVPGSPPPSGRHHSAQLWTPSANTGWPAWPGARAAVTPDPRVPSRTPLSMPTSSVSRTRSSPHTLRQTTTKARKSPTTPPRKAHPQAVLSPVYGALPAPGGPSGPQNLIRRINATRDSSDPGTSGISLMILPTASFLAFPKLPRHVNTDYRGRVTQVYLRPLTRPG